MVRTMKRTRTTWSQKLGFAAALTCRERKMLRGYRFEPTGDLTACYPTQHGSNIRPEQPLVLDWKQHVL